MLREGNTPLSSLADIHYGKSPNAVRNPRGHVPVIGTGGVTGRATASLFDGPAVVVGRKGTLDKPFYINEPFWPIDTTYAVIAKKDVDTKWLYYSLCTTDLKKLNEATGVPSINRDFLGRVEFFTPKEPEQRAIARVLDTVDEAMEATSAMLAKQEKIKQGLLQDLLTRGVDEKGHLRPTYAEAPNLYRHPPIGWLPKGWDVLPIAKLIDNIIDFRGRTPLKIGMNWGGGDIPALSARNVKMGAIDLTLETYYGSEALYRKWMTSGETRKNDILVTMEAPLGNIALVPDDKKYILSQRTILLQTNPAMVNNLYLKYQMMAERFQTELVANSTGTTATGIQRKKFEKIEVVLPQPSEQLMIARALFAVDETLNELSNELTKLRALKAGLMQDLLTGEKRVTPALMQQIQQQAA